MFTLVNVCVFVVLAILVHVPPPLVENSHLTTKPVLPDKVTVPLFVTPHTGILAGDNVPPTEAATTVNVAV
jgi:hypothetical protein